MLRIVHLLGFEGLLLAFVGLAHAAETPSFRRDIAPVLVAQCVTCHGAEKQKGGYRVDSFARLLQAGDSGERPIIPADAGASHLFHLLTTSDADDRMPQKADPLSRDTIERFRQWISNGAVFDGDDPEQSLAGLLDAGPYLAPPERYAFPVPILAVAFASEDRLLLGGYRELTVWSNAGRLMRRIPNVPERLYALALHRDGRRVFYAGGIPGRRGEAGMIDLEKAGPPAILLRTADVLLTVTITASGDRLAVGGADRLITMFDTGTGATLRTISSHADWVMDLDFSPDGRQIASASRDRTARVFDVATGEMSCAYRGHNEAVSAVRFVDAGKRVASAGRDARIHLWSITNVTKAKMTSVLGGEMTRLLVRNESLLSGCADGMVREHRLGDLELVRRFGPATDRVVGLAVHAPTDMLAATTHDGQVQLWQLEKGERFGEFVAVPRSEVISTGN